MAEIVLLGINHKTAPVELRECIAFSSEDSAAAMQKLHREPSIREVLLYSTCNRVEVLLVADEPRQAVVAAKNLIAASNGISLHQFEQALYIHHGDAAVRHIFRVAASLDSMVVGEPQILGQIKQAYRTATEVKTSGVILNRLLHRSFFVAKRIRTETGIGDRAVSVSYAAVELGRKIFGTLAQKEVLLIGAGEMAELAVEHLLRQQAGNILVANRTFENGVQLAQRFRGQAIRFEEIPEALRQVDIIISSTGAPGFVITREQVKAVIRSRRNRPLFFIDIAVPRDVDPEVNRLTNSYVYDIDDLKGVIENNLEDRMQEAVRGERIIDEAVIRFRQWYESLAVVPTIVSLRRKLEAIAEAEIKKTLNHISISNGDSRALYAMTNAIINKILHDPTIFLKNDRRARDQSLYLDVIRKLFKLDG